MELKTEQIVFLNSVPVDTQYYRLDISDSDLTKDFAKFLETSRYEYSLKVSKGAVEFLSDVVNGYTVDELANLDYSLGYDALSNVIQIPSLIKNHLGAYQLMQGIILETTTLTYVLDNNPDYLENYSNSTFNTIRENINFIVDWLGDYEDYRVLIQYFRDLYMAVSYSQNQIQLLIGEL